MNEKLYTRVSPGFDKASFSGVLIAGPDLDDTYGFTELGYDAVDYSVAPTVLEVTPSAKRYATRADIEAAAAKAGIQVWMTREQYLSDWPGATEAEWAENVYPATDEVEPNQLLENPEVRRHLEEAGFDAFHGIIVVTNSQAEIYAFWDTSTFEVSGPVELTIADPNEPYDVTLAAPAATPRA